MEVKPWGFGAQKKCPFPLNRGVRSKEVTNTKIIWRFCRDQILCPLNEGVPAWIEVSQRLHCTRLCRKMGQKLTPKLFHDMIRLRTAKWPKHFGAPIWQTLITLISHLRQTVYKSEFVLRDPSFPFTCRLQFIVTITKKIGRYTPILYIRIVLSSFISLLLMHFENISSWILRLP